ncbi:ribonuclease H-like domain-containing protein [Truncatella angustata]|uniref:Ribonuclease H-like domain-containing protein n=1 Tax=Truncatella angustata TaxID=152316 RepID=A0A9P8UFN4_9PEZI|nr:ribonuclease H-like domain-containing protein [Truncatella angustata]KAH6649097.1 ribonuclease H-like domain-containing protein [Truncatella angustata]
MGVSSRSSQTGHVHEDAIPKSIEKAILPPNVADSFPHQHIQPRHEQSSNIPSTSTSFSLSPPITTTGDIYNGTGDGESKPLSKYTPRTSKPLVFRTPPKYPPFNCKAASCIRHKCNKYSLFDNSDQEILFYALQLRCHSRELLRRKGFPTVVNIWSSQKIKLPAGINAEDFLMAPEHSSRTTHRVVAIDCEMVGVGSGHFEGTQEKQRSELAQLCAVDVLTGEVLIDKLVNPLEKVIDWRTRFSGVSRSVINTARRQGKLLLGWRAARSELFTYIDADTIMVGHALHNDLLIMRLVHSNVVDTSFQTAEAVFGSAGIANKTWGLKVLAKDLTNLSIQVDKKGHDCTEDTLATREVAIWCLCHPDELAVWATQRREEQSRLNAEREKRLREKRRRQVVTKTEILFSPRHLQDLSSNNSSNDSGNPETLRRNA